MTKTMKVTLRQTEKCDSDRNRENTSERNRENDNDC